MSQDVVSKMPARDQLNLNTALQHPLELSLSQRQVPFASTPFKNQPLHKSTNCRPTEFSMGKCQIVFSDASHDKEVNEVQLMLGNDTRCVRKTPSRSNCSSSACLTQETEAKLLKRQYFQDFEAEICSQNLNGVKYNSLRSYESAPFPNGITSTGLSGMVFPNISKKKRTTKWNRVEISKVNSMSAVVENCSIQNAYWTSEAQKNQLTPASTSWVPATQYDFNRHSRYSEVNYATLNERQISGSSLELAEYRNAKRKRSKGPTRPRSTPLGSCEQLLNYRRESTIDQEVIDQPNRCMELLVSQFPATVKTKKRSKRNSTTSSSLPYLYKQQHSLKTGRPLAITWKQMSPMDEIIEHLSLLDINAEGTLGLYHNQNNPLQMDYLQQNALVVYRRDGTIVPVRKRKPRPKVDLDDETTRVWKLLLEDIRNEGIDGTDEEKARWWEEERRVFRGRADSFIARMHLVQGDRRFTPWKGSVVDSVVGVFLTQNVSDHLSSSAFMSLAARYPPKSSINPGESLGEETSMTNREPEVFVLEPDDIVTCYEKADQSTRAQSSLVQQHLEGNRGKEANNVSRVDASTIQVDIASTQNSVEFSVARSEKSEITTNVARVDGSAIQVDLASTQNSVDFSIARSEKSEINSLCTSEEESTDSERKPIASSTSFVELIHTVEGNPELEEVFQSNSEVNLSEKRDWFCSTEAFSSQISLDISSGLHEVPISGSPECSRYDDKETCTTENSGLSAGSPNQTTFEKIRRAQFEELPKSSSEDENSCYNHGIDVSLSTIEDPESVVESQFQHQALDSHNLYTRNSVVSERNMVAKNIPDLNEKPASSTFNANSEQLDNIADSGNANTANEEVRRPGKQNQVAVDWDALRKDVQKDSIKRERTANTMDSLDWETIRCADVQEIADTIKSRGMNNMLAERIKDFLDRIVREHGSIDLEWLRDVLPDKAKEYLLSIRGLGLKSVECVRLLTLHHLAFPVDVNVGRIAVRLGWVPLQPLPESLQLHLLELYPVLESIQKYLWPRLCKLDQRTLYELHYQMITFGKVFCSKSKPNCNACPMRGECRHFASAFASARLTLPAPEEKRIVVNGVEQAADPHSTGMHSTEKLCLPHAKRQLGDDVQSSVASSNSSSTDLCLARFNKHFGANSESSSSNLTAHVPAITEPTVEEPLSPEPENDQFVEPDMEDFEDPDEIPTIRLDMEQFAQNLQNLVGGSMELQEHNISKALVTLTTEATSIPAPKLKNINRLRTEHQVYELPDSHPLLHRFDRREPDDPSPYLLAIWTPGETADSIQPPERRCRSQESGGLCDDETCFSCNSTREANSQIVRGTILVPCRTAMRGSFPLNGTYFQVNEVFADHDSSLSPVAVPRAWIWNLPRRTVYFGTSVPSIFRGLNTEEIQYCFWRGFVCVRGFEQCSRSPKPLMARLHFPASRMRGKAKVDE
ncbi:DNA-binding transcription factor [Lithospermum erythrorhizon]|uniref:DNA-binding transcription factor n=1 Tax=Lithospermum erythrorhizon TaxID=34254 RepID=A0AAV3QZI5_LITER